MGPRYATKENRMKFQLSPPSVSQEFSLVVKLYSPTLCALWLGVWLCKPPFSLTHNPPLAVSLGGATRKRKDAKEEGSSSVDSIASHLAAVIGFYSQVVFFVLFFLFSPTVYSCPLLMPSASQCRPSECWAVAKWCPPLQFKVPRRPESSVFPSLSYDNNGSQLSKSFSGACSIPQGLFIPFLTISVKAGNTFVLLNGHRLIKSLTG